MTKYQLKLSRMIRKLKKEITEIDYDNKEITIIRGGRRIKFFWHNQLNKFILFYLSNNECEIIDVEFTERLTLKLRKLIDDYIEFQKEKRKNGNKPYRVIGKRPKDKNSRK